MVVMMSDSATMPSRLKVWGGSTFGLALAGRRLVVGGAAAARLLAAGLVRTDPLGAADPPQGVAVAGGLPRSSRPYGCS